jgi:hypothetical protein
MITVRIFGRSRFEFAELFPEANFEGYEYNIRYAYFAFKNKISKNKIQTLCDSKKIKINFE